MALHVLAVIMFVQRRQLSGCHVFILYIIDIHERKLLKRNQNKQSFYQRKRSVTVGGD